MVKTVVILGGAYAGVQIAHYLLKLKNKDLKVVLVSQNSHFYWNLASIRYIIPGQVKDEQLFQPLEAALKRYPAESWELVIGTAEASDFAAKTVEVKTAEGPKTLSYDHLVLATGARTPGNDVPWKAVGTYESTLALLNSTAEKVKAANHIIVAGGGATGLELAGELGCEFGKTKEIVLLNAGKALLGGDSLASNAASELQKLNVKVKYDSYVESATTLPDGKTEVLLKSGDKITTDLYLPTHGLVPNSEYVDSKYLDERKNVVVDEFYRVAGTENVWAAGDIVCKPRAGFMIAQKHAGGVGKNIEAALQGKPPSPIKLMPFDMLACSVGRYRGVGRAGPVKIFSFVVNMAKGKTLGMQMLPTYIDGSVA
ncbi:FAD/NAD(P)-binding domain-containing protein [Thozetella sp. PMI_491]|nr:FAD/NAD(P)-binding domain-containing protein [Thozetella sp. PMI_491]